MNVENVNKLIEATKAYEGFGFQSGGTCFMAVMRDMKVARPYGIGKAEAFGGWLELPFPVYNELFFGTDYANSFGSYKAGDEMWEKIDKAHALRTLEHLKATGTVDWAATKEG